MINDKPLHDRYVEAQFDLICETAKTFNKALFDGQKMLAEIRQLRDRHPGQIPRAFSMPWALTIFALAARLSSMLSGHLVASIAPRTQAVIGPELTRIWHHAEPPCTTALRMASYVRNEVAMHLDAQGHHARFPDAEVAASALEDGANHLSDYAALLREISEATGRNGPGLTKPLPHDAELLLLAAESNEFLSQGLDLLAKALRDAAGSSSSAAPVDGDWINCRLLDGGLAPGRVVPAPQRRTKAKALEQAVPVAVMGANATPSFFEYDPASREFVQVSDSAEHEIDAEPAAASKRTESFGSVARRAEHSIKAARALRDECEELLGQSTRWTHASISGIARVHGLSAIRMLAAAERIAERLESNEHAGETKAASLATALRDSAVQLRSVLDRLQSDDFRIKCFKNYERPVATQWHELLRAGEIASVQRRALATEPPGMLYEFRMNARAAAAATSTVPAVVVHVHLHEPPPAGQPADLDWRNVAAAHLKRADQAALGAQWQRAEQARGHGESALIHRATISQDFLADLVRATTP